MHKDSKDRHREKLGQNDHYNDMQESQVPDKVRERFRRPPYQITDVTGYMAKKFNIKKKLEK